MGRLGAMERRFLAEILHGLITRDYHRAAAVHFDAGYVPPYHSKEIFAQAMRAIGEPIHGRTAAEISMADLLGQLFAYTEVFDMATRPELILLQKTMVVVEGVARSLDPELNIWTAAEPIAREWVDTTYGMSGRLKEAGEGAEVLGRVMAEVPRFLEQVERTARTLADMARGGLSIDDASIERLAAAQAHHNRTTRWALWTIALALLTALVWLLVPAR
jgi:ubiquinone biosynthesis protein